MASPAPPHAPAHAHSADACAPPPCDADADACWICLDGARDGSPLVAPCQCPRLVHRACLAKWQLTSAGKNEETRCRFCDRALPDWRPALTPGALKPAASVMSVRYRGVTHRITYTPGPDGLEQFLDKLRAIGIKVASASQVTFLCRSPDSGEEMALKGLGAFDAAAYCASITAAKRLARKEARARQQQAEQEEQEVGEGAGAVAGDRPAAAGAAAPLAAVPCDFPPPATTTLRSPRTSSASTSSAAAAAAVADEDELLDEEDARGYRPCGGGGRRRSSSSGSNAGGGGEGGGVLRSLVAGLLMQLVPDVADVCPEMVAAGRQQQQPPVAAAEEVEEEEEREQRRRQQQAEEEQQHAEAPRATAVSSSSAGDSSSSSSSRSSSVAGDDFAGGPLQRLARGLRLAVMSARGRW